MDPIFGVVFAVFLLASSGAVASWWLSDEQVARRRLALEPDVPIASLRPGQRVKVTGRLVLEDRLRAPLSRRDCAAWWLRVEEPQGVEGWRVLVRRSESVPFWLQDAYGDRVRIDAATARFLVNLQPRGSCGILDQADPVQRAVLDEHGLPLRTASGFGRTYRFHEGRLDAGARVVVSGVVAIGERGEEVFLTLVPPSDGELLVTNAPEAAAL